MERCNKSMPMSLSAWKPQFQPFQKKQVHFLKPLGKYPGRRGGISFCGRKDAVSDFDCAKPSYWPGKSLESHGNLRGSAKRQFAGCVTNSVGSTSQAVPVSEDLKSQLESLHEEALQVRERYNNARARFMRLTEVAQKLQQRAALDVKLGNEESARKLLIEKQKVIRAAELSKKRANLLEELSNKLGEAISTKETQLIVALSGAWVWVKADEEPNVRVVSPKDATGSSFDTDLINECNYAGTEIPEGSPSVVGAQESDGIQTQSAESISTEKSGSAVSGELAYDFRVEDVSSKKSDSSHDNLLAGEEEVDISMGTLDRKNDNSLLASHEFEDNISDLDLQIEKPISSESYMDALDVTLSFDSSFREGPRVSESTEPAGTISNSANISNAEASSLVKGEAKKENDSEIGVVSGNCDEMGGDMWDIDPDNEDLLTGRSEVVGTDDNANFYEGKSMVFKGYMQEVDYQISVAESKLRKFSVMALNNKDINAEQLQLVEELLKKFQSLRIRLSEAVRELAQKEIQ